MPAAAPAADPRHRPRARRRHRRRPRRPHRRLPARQGRPPAHGARGHRRRRRHQPDRRARRLALRHRRPPLLHQGAPRSRRSGTRSSPTRTSCSGPARAASTTRASSSTTRSSRSTPCAPSASIEAIRCGLSFLWVRVRPPKDQTTLEGYVVANYGWRLYGHFFKTYSEKVWAVPPSEISADWGAQRIKGMSLWTAVWEPVRAKLAGRRGKGQQVTSLIEEFQYPKYGPGMMWERCQELVEAQGSKVVFDAPVTRITPRRRAGPPSVARRAAPTYDADHVISSMPFTHLLRAMDPPVPAEVQQAADDLAFRDFLSVALVVPADKVAWTDNWIYIHAPEVKTMRVQNFGSWSPYMVKDGRNVLGLEYTVHEGDEWWTASDEELVEKGKAELEALGPHAGRRRRGRLRGADAEGVPGLRRGLPGQRRRAARLARGQHARTCTPSAATACTGTTTRTTRCTRPCSRSRTSSGPPTTSGTVNVEEEYHEEGDPPPGTKGTGRDAPILPKRPASHRVARGASSPPSRWRRPAGPGGLRARRGPRRPRVQRPVPLPPHGRGPGPGRRLPDLRRAHAALAAGLPVPALARLPGHQRRPDRRLPPQRGALHAGDPARPLVRPAVRERPGGAGGRRGRGGRSRASGCSPAPSSPSRSRPSRSCSWWAWSSGTRPASRSRVVLGAGDRLVGPHPRRGRAARPVVVVGWWPPGPVAAPRWRPSPWSRGGRPCW